MRPCGRAHAETLRFRRTEGVRRTGAFSVSVEPAREAPVKALQVQRCVSRLRDSGLIWTFSVSLLTQKTPS